jgi:hypothetical protein
MRGLCRRMSADDSALGRVNDSGMTATTANPVCAVHYLRNLSIIAHIAFGNSIDQARNPTLQAG